MFENMLIHIDDMEGGGLGILKGCDIQWPFPTSFQTDFHRFSRWCTWLGVIHVVRLHLCWKHLEWLVRTWVIDLFCFFRIIYEPDHEVLLFKFSCQHVVPVQLANTMAPVRAYWGRGTVFQNLIPSISLVFPFLPWMWFGDISFSWFEGIMLQMGDGKPLFHMRWDQGWFISYFRPTLPFPKIIFCDHSNLIFYCVLLVVCMVGICFQRSGPRTRYPRWSPSSEKNDSGCCLSTRNPKFQVTSSPLYSPHYHIKINQIINGSFFSFMSWHSQFFDGAWASCLWICCPCSWKGPN